VNSHCCGDAPGAVKKLRLTSAPGRFREVVRWIVPSAILVAMPKCPACVAAYIALFTGVGLSFSAAAHLRVGVLALCFATFAILGAKHASAILRRLKPRPMSR
jgi:hypothetical protein